MKKLNGIMIVELIKECGFTGYEIALSTKQSRKYKYTVKVIDKYDKNYSVTVEETGDMSYIIKMLDENYSELCYDFVHKLSENLA